jgi:hypothetical protein
MSGACGAYGGEKGIDHLEDLGVDVRIILKLIFKILIILDSRLEDKTFCTE